ncbi:four-helix bundle copper-binding protein [Kribbella sancticallisti]|uniref:Four-helix bundle copper-binding protein n=1 Tax=Kribbella sancticallisti TaxID=460087 RepID=A0ABN2DMG1_9ACTN
MTVVEQMLETYPKDLGQVDQGKLSACIQACIDCAQACTACADACLSEDKVAELTKCIRDNLDCADLCDTTGRVLSRHTGYDANLTRTVLEACAAACRTCGDECERHADMHEHCRICAATCHRCEQACQALLDSLGPIEQPREPA